MKVWAKIRETNENYDIFHSPNIAQAVYGFRELGAEIIPYVSINDIYDLVSEEDIVLDYIDQVQSIFKKFNVNFTFPNYPDILSEFLGRKIWTDTIDNINSHPEKWGVFVKPLNKEKASTGRVINEPKDLIGCGSCYENYDVLCSEVLDIKREWRGFFYYGELIDIRPYKGDYHYQYDPKVLDKIIKKFNEWENRPIACSIDIGVTSDGKTVLIECNDCYALGCYGLYHLQYAKMISARWSQLFNRKDEFYFGV